MAETFAALAQEFNESAVAVLKAPAALPFFAAKYRVLLTNLATTEEEKTELATVLLDTLLEVLNRIAKPAFNNSMSEGIKLLTPVFDALAMPESLHALPSTAADKIAHIALKLSMKGETLDPDSFMDPIRQEPIGYDAFRKALLEVTEMAVRAAQSFKVEIDSRTISIETSKPVTASRPLQLQAGANAR